MTKVFAALAGLLIISCSDDGVSVPPDIPIQTLLTTPDTIVVENRKMYLSTFLWRDFQPVSPKDGKPLIALVYVTGVDTMQLRITISADAVWIVYINQAWKSWLVNQDIPPADVKQNCLVKIARDGPKRPRLTTRPRWLRPAASANSKGTAVPRHIANLPKPSVNFTQAFAP